MEILTVGEKQDNKLYVIRINDVRFLVGCSVDIEQTLNYIPHGIELFSDDERAANKTKRDEEKAANKRYKTIDNNKFLLGEVKYDLSVYTSVDIASIDYILITKLDNIYALPILTEGFKFEGSVIMTQPLHQMGYQILKEFAQMNEQRKQKGSAFDSEAIEDMDEFPYVKNIWEDTDALDQLEKEGKYIGEWVSAFNQEDLDACWEKVKVVNYKEELTVRSDVKVSASASGYHIGSACFSLGFGQDKLLVMDSFSYHRYRHCMPFDYKVLRDHNKVLITDCFYSSDEVKPKSEGESRLTQAELCVNRFVGVIKRVLKEHKNENILLPVRNLFFLLDIIDTLKEKVTGFRKIHIITSTAEPIIKYANANVDYLNKVLQSKIYQSKPELPFSFDRFVEENKIQFFEGLHEFVEKIKFKPNYMTDNVPSLYLVVDSTFRLGFSGKIFDIFNNELNGGTVIFTDPFVCHSKIFEPLFHMNKLRIINFPMNLNDSLVSTVNLIKKDTADSKIIVPEKYSKVLKQSPIGERIMTLKDNSAIEMEMSTKDSLYTKPSTYSSIKPRSLEAAIPYKLEKNDVSIDSFFGTLSSAADKMILNVQEMKKEEHAAVLIQDRHKKLNDQNMIDKMYDLAKKLQENGLQVTNVDKKADETATYVVKCSQSVIKHTLQQTEIYTDNDQEYKTIVKCLKSVLGVCLI